MTQTSRKIMVEVEERTRKCDFCDCAQVTRTGSFPRGITTCDVCEKDICHQHTNWYQENPSGDHYDARICPECRPAFDEAWTWAEANAGRYDSLMDVVKKRLAATVDAQQ